MRVGTATLLLALVIPATSARQEPRPEWDDPAVLQVGAERPHATMVVYPDAAAARTRQRERSPWFQSLNGRIDWKQVGVGGIDSGTRLAYPMELYRIPPEQRYSYSYWLKPVGGR